MSADELNEVLKSLDGRTFSSYLDMTMAILETFNANLEKFPPHYHFDDFVTWLDFNHWLVAPQSLWSIRIPEEATYDPAGAERDPEVPERQVLPVVQGHARGHARDLQREPREVPVALQIRGLRDVVRHQRLDGAAADPVVHPHSRGGTS